MNGMRVPDCGIQRRLRCFPTQTGSFTSGGVDMRPLGERSAVGPPQGMALGREARLAGLGRARDIQA